LPVLTLPTRRSRIASAMRACRTVCRRATSCRCSVGAGLRWAFRVPNPSGPAHFRLALFRRLYGRLCRRLCRGLRFCPYAVIPTERHLRRGICFWLVHSSRFTTDSVPVVESRLAFKSEISNFKSLPAARDKRIASPPSAIGTIFVSRTLLRDASLAPGCLTRTRQKLAQCGSVGSKSENAFLPLACP
jgi:hypothetical protein